MIDMMENIFVDSVECDLAAAELHDLTTDEIDAVITSISANNESIKQNSSSIPNSDDLQSDVTNDANQGDLNKMSVGTAQIHNYSSATFEHDNSERSAEDDTQETELDADVVMENNVFDIIEDRDENTSSVTATGISSVEKINSELPVDGETAAVEDDVIDIIENPSEAENTFSVAAVTLSNVQNSEQPVENVGIHAIIPHDNPSNCIDDGAICDNKQIADVNHNNIEKEKPHQFTQKRKAESFAEEDDELSASEEQEPAHPEILKPKRHTKRRVTSLGRPKKKRRTDGYFEVEKILNHKEVNGQILYEVKWKNYDDSNNLWVKIEAFSQPDVMLNRYYMDKLDDAQNK